MPFISETLQESSPSILSNHITYTTYTVENICSSKYAEYQTYMHPRLRCLVLDESTISCSLRSVRGRYLTIITEPV